MATFKNVSTFRRSEVWDYFKFSWGCLLLVVRVLADWLLFLNLLFNSAVLLLVTEQLLALDLSCDLLLLFFPLFGTPLPQNGARSDRHTHPSLSTPLLSIVLF